METKMLEENTSETYSPGIKCAATTQSITGSHSEVKKKVYSPLNGHANGSVSLIVTECNFSLNRYKTCNCLASPRQGS